MGGCDRRRADCTPLGRSRFWNPGTSLVFDDVTASLPDKSHTTQHSPERITATTEEAFHLRFLAQSAEPGTYMATGPITH
ncbi:hypothetical protein OG243_04100 [Streptomyces sp. NBC_01318]|uniref:hypothetical protein n=1 Tax=Streptomyces sp. NBC_01318 TaxID=2903823 RepID=UPI002E125022|nr:hypothetical protein OG243_04100 [Streptomyces sp. NBC_01318]